MTINAFPLQWPIGWKRTDAATRQAARFTGRTEKRATYGDGQPHVYFQSRALTIAEGRRRVLEELQRMGLSRDDVVLSTNLPLRRDGEPRSDAREPADPGAAVYWQESGGARRVMAIDRYDRVADNLAAIAATLDAMRAIERHGGAVILERAFTGFTALPPPGGSASSRHWRDVLGVPSTVQTPETLKAAYRRAISGAHPDRHGGADAAAAAVNLAYEQAKQELGFS